MFRIKPYILICLALVFSSCETDYTADFKLTTNDDDGGIKSDESLIITIENPKNHKIDSTVYHLDNNRAEKEMNLSQVKLGNRTVQVKLYLNNGSTHTISKLITVLSSQTPKIYGFNIINEYPHDITSYTQGLEFYKGELYESTGEYGESKLRKVDYKSGEVLQNVDLSPKELVYKILDDVNKFSTSNSKYQDDKTLVVIKKREN